MKRILVIVDVQNDFITGSLGNAECQTVIPNIINVIKDGDYQRIILTRDTHHEDYLNTLEGKNLPVTHCIEKSEGWLVNEEVLNAICEKSYQYQFIDKPTFGSLELGKTLHEEYTENNMDIQVDFVGVCTGICVISNVLIAKTYCPEATIRVIEDACACVTPESHKTAIDAMKLCQVEII